MSASAQSQNPNEILDLSKAAIQEIDGFSAQFKMKGEGGSMFANTMPSMSGQLFFGTLETSGRVIHCIGEIREQKNSASKPVNILLASDRYLWTDRPTKSINEYPSAGTTRGLPASFPLVLIQSITQNDPFERDLNNAQSIDLLDQATVGGVLCDVIHIKRTKANPQTRQPPSEAYTDAQWYIGVDDKLPRKVEHITDAGLVKITLGFTLSNLKPVMVTQEQLDIPRPEGFEFKSRMPKPRPDPAPDQVIEPSPPSANPAQREPAGPGLRIAPSYAFTPDGGSQVTNAKQEGRITVLYFWGSWCVPCKAASPLVSELAQAFGADTAQSPVDVFGLAIREADPSQTRADFVKDGYHHRLVLDGDDLVAAFRVRVFPTIVVINAAGEIAFEGHIKKEMGVKELVESAKEAIEKALMDQ